jgi:cytochrome c-type biogenesis protein CcmF
LFIALGEPLDNNAWAVRVYYKPFVVWIWLGAGIMALGGILSMADPRYRLQKIAKWQQRGQSRQKPASPEAANGS